jgi:putative MATE family efflux protein
MKPKTQTDMLASGAIGKLLWKLSLPSVAGVMAMSLYNIVDIIFIGKATGPIGIAALTVVFPIQMLLVAAAQCIGIGGGSRISRKMGAGNKEDAGKTFGNMAVMGAIVGFFFLALGLLIPHQLLRLFGATDAILPSAYAYFHILILSSPVVALTLVTLNAVRAEGNAKMAMAALIIGTGMNTLLDPIFIFVLDMGIRGAALATLVSDILSAVFLVSYYVNRKNEFPIGWQYLRFVRKIDCDVLAVGSASIIGAITMSVTTILMNNIMTKTGGAIALAAIGIIWRLFMFLTTPLSAINQGLQPIVGYNFGAEKYTRVVGSIRIACIFSTTLMTVAALLFYRYPEFFIRIFTKDPELISAGQSALRIASICLPLVGFLTVGGSIFQTLGKSTSAIIVSLARQGAIQVPSALILFVFFGLGGIWFSFPISHALSFALTLFLLKRDLKKIAPPSTEGVGRTDTAFFFKLPPSIARLSMIVVFTKKFLPFF